ncbi:hypothetical protein [Prauserella sp. PE36]|uniref:hypothetical protein n=1 Tax=Prauserella sp. PE36 TaxID=1504709 RepID=UPI0011BE6FAF|nr:hypothetical protein [Prauserella sp. PE36]
MIAFLSGTFAAHARFNGTVLTDPRRLQRLLRRDDPGHLAGTFATCVFNRDKALCHPHGDHHGTRHPDQQDGQRHDRHDGGQPTVTDCPATALRQRRPHRRQHHRTAR